MLCYLWPHSDTSESQSDTTRKDKVSLIGHLDVHFLYLSKKILINVVPLNQIYAFKLFEITNIDLQNQ